MTVSSRGTHRDHPRAPLPEAPRSWRQGALPNEVTALRDARPGDAIVEARELAGREEQHP